MYIYAYIYIACCKCISLFSVLLQLYYMVLWILTCPTCSMKDWSTAHRGWVYSLLMESCCRRGPGGGSICGGQGCPGGTASHGGSIHQGGRMWSRSPHTRRSWNVSVDRRTVEERHEFSSCETPGSIAAWRLFHTVHTCKDEYLQQMETLFIYMFE